MLSCRMLLVCAFATPAIGGLALGSLSLGSLCAGCVAGVNVSKDDDGGTGGSTGGTGPFTTGCFFESSSSCTASACPSRAAK